VWGEVRAELTVAADGRASKVRSLVGLEPQPLAEPMEVLWFRLPRRESDPDREESGITTGGDTPFIVLERADHWQIGLPLPHGGYRTLRNAGIEDFQQRLIRALPEFTERIRCELTEWRDIALLTVRSSRLRQWWQPGLLLIGDAAHVMTPVGGVGINYAVQDAIVAANVLVDPLQQHGVTAAHLAEIQRQREWPTRVIQLFQRVAQARVVTPALASGQPFDFPWYVHLLTRIPLLRDLPARLIGFGVRRVRVQVV
jgi:2-polyprenyl-6-methoxyphenol hydroxylase-like FAD-dependent oxidoreductase